MKDYNKIWRRCNALDMDGKRCSNKTKLKQSHYHGDPEIYGSCYNHKEPAWVIVSFCEEHREKE